LPAIHLMYDPLDKVSLPPADQITKLGVSVIVLALPLGLDISHVQETSKKLAELLLDRIAADAVEREGQGVVW
jgi:hypothetical protein